MVIELTIFNSGVHTYNVDCSTLSVLSFIVMEYAVNDFGVITVYKDCTCISSWIEGYVFMLNIPLTIVIWIVNPRRPPIFTPSAIVLDARFSFFTLSKLLIG